MSNRAQKTGQSNAAIEPINRRTDFDKRNTDNNNNIKSPTKDGESKLFSHYSFRMGGT